MSRESPSSSGRRGSVKVVNVAPNASRRCFLEKAAVHGISLSVACILLGREGLAAPLGQEPETTPGKATPRKGALRLPAVTVESDPSAVPVRDLADPYLEVLRLLR